MEEDFKSITATFHKSNESFFSQLSSVSDLMQPKFQKDIDNLA